MKRATPFFGCVGILLFALVAWSQQAEEISGTVASIDAGASVIVLEDGRRVQVVPGAVILLGGRTAPLTALVPGTRVVIRQGQVTTGAPDARSQVLDARPGAPEQGETMTVQVPAATMTVQVPRQTIIVESQAPQIVVQQPAPEVVVKPAPAPQIQGAPLQSQAAPAAMPPPPPVARALPPADLAVPVRPQQSENRYVYDQSLAGRPTGPTQTQVVVPAPPPKAAQATAAAPMVIIAEPPEPAASVDTRVRPRPLERTDAWCGDTLGRRRSRFIGERGFEDCQAP